MPVAFLSLSCEIDIPDKFTGIPTLYHPKNDLDALGASFDLMRLEGEDGSSYWSRLLSVYPQPANSTITGLVNGITRELGLEQYVGIKILPRTIGARYAAANPFVEISTRYCTLYSSYTDSSTNVIDYQVDITLKSGAYSLQDLVDAINTNSNYFSASLGPVASGDEQARGLLPGASFDIAYREYVPPSKAFLFKNQNIIPGTALFSEQEIFVTQTSPIEQNPTNAISLACVLSTPVISAGQYYINYKDGIVYSYSTPSGNGYCRYWYRKFPFYVMWSPISVYSMKDSEYLTKVFEQESFDDGDRNGIVSYEGSNICQQSFLKSPCLWGK